jgi:hypothetical protein
MCLNKKEKEGYWKGSMDILGHRIKLGCLIASDATPFESPFQSRLAA